MAEFMPKINGKWAENENGSRTSSSSSADSEVQLPSVKNLASRFNALAVTSPVFRGPALYSKQNVTQMKSSGSANLSQKNTTASAVHKTVPPSQKTVVKHVKSEPVFDDDDDDDDDDEVFVKDSTDIRSPQASHFKKRDQAQKTKPDNFSSQHPPQKKWSSLSDLHSSQMMTPEPSTYADSTSSTSIFGVSLKRVDRKSWGVYAVRKPTAESSDSSSDGSRPGSPDFAVWSTKKTENYTKTSTSDEKVEHKRSGGGVKSKISHKMGGRSGVQYHSQSDLTSVSTEGGLWRRQSISDLSDTANRPPPLVRRQSISELLKLYRTKSQTDLSQQMGERTKSQSDLSQIADNQRYEMQPRPKTPVQAPLTMYDLKIVDPMNKPKTPTYKSSTKDIVRLPPGVSITSIKSVSPKKTMSENTAQTQISKPQVSTSVKVSVSMKTPVISKPTENYSSTVTLGSPENMSTKQPSNPKGSEETKPKPVQKRYTYIPPPKHFNRPNTVLPKPPPKKNVVEKPTVEKKESNAEKLSRMVTPTSYPGHRDSLPTSTGLKKNSRSSSSSSSSDAESIKQPESSVTNNPVSKIISSFNKNKSSPFFPKKHDTPPVAAQDPVWTEKYTAAVHEDSPVQPFQAADYSKEIKDAAKRTSSSSETSDEADGIPHDEKGFSYIVTKSAKGSNSRKQAIASPSAPKVVASPSAPKVVASPAAPKVVAVQKKERDRADQKPSTNVTNVVEKESATVLSKKDSVARWENEVNADTSDSSAESEDENKPATETSGLYVVNNNHSPKKIQVSTKSHIPTSTSHQEQEAKKSNVALVSRKNLGEDDDVFSQSSSKAAKPKSQITDGRKPPTIASEVLQPVTHIRRNVPPRKASSSSDDGNQQKQSRLPTPVKRSSVKTSKVNADVEQRVTKKPTPRKDSIDGKSSAHESSSGEASSTGDQFKEFDPYAIGRMIVRGARKSTSVVKKPENLTNIRNASIPAHSPFSPIKSPTSEKSFGRSSGSSDEELKQKPRKGGAVNGRYGSSSSEEHGTTVKKTNKSILQRASSSASSDGLDLEIENDSEHDEVYSARVVELV